MTFAKGVILCFSMAYLTFAAMAMGKSMVSVAAAGGVGVLGLVMFVLSMKLENPRWAYIGTLVLALVGCGRFLMKLIMDGTTTPFPNMAAIAVSGLTILCLLGAHFVVNARKQAATQANQ